MKTIMKVEWYKLRRKKDVCILTLLFFLIPLILSLCIKFKVGSINLTGTSQITIPEYTITIWMLMKMLFLPYLLFTYTALSSLGKEVEQKTISIELLKSSRKNVLLSKILLSGLLSVFGVLLAFLSGILGSMLLKDTVLQTFKLSEGNWSFSLVIILQILAMILLVSFTNLIGTFCGNLKGMLLVLGTIILQKGLAQVGVLEKIMPVSILNPSTYIDTVMDAGKADVLKYNIGIFAYILIFILIINALTYFVWKKKDFM